MNEGVARGGELVVVLVAPEHDGNIGATARAMGNLGLRTLRLVRGVPPDAAARAMACSSQDVLEAATHHDDLASALADCVLAVAMVSPMRQRDVAAADLRGLRGRILDACGEGNVALVFGGEQSGLEREDVARCNVAASLHLPSARPTLNLAQAVLLTGYELRQVEGVVPTPARQGPGVESLATHADVDALLRAARALLSHVGYVDGDGGLQERIVARTRALLLRAGVSDADMRMLHGLLARFDPRRC